MTVNITTWRPDTCDCEFSFIVDDDNPTPQFYAVHDVCEHHEHLMTKGFSSESRIDLHKTRTDNKIHHVHSALEHNVARHQERLAKETRRRTRRELESVEPLIHQHNLKVKQQFEDIFAEPFAHDEHIYTAVLAENQNKNITIGKIHELHPDEPVEFEFDTARKLILKVHKDKAVSLHKRLGNDKVSIVPVSDK